MVGVHQKLRDRRFGPDGRPRGGLHHHEPSDLAVRPRRWTMRDWQQKTWDLRAAQQVDHPPPRRRFWTHLQRHQRRRSGFQAISRLERCQPAPAPCHRSGQIHVDGAPDEQRRRSSGGPRSAIRFHTRRFVSAPTSLAKCYGGHRTSPNSPKANVKFVTKPLTSNRFCEQPTKKHTFTARDGVKKHVTALTKRPDRSLDANIMTIANKPDVAYRVGPVPASTDPASLMT
jgi:hypothetical protein